MTLDHAYKLEIEYPQTQRRVVSNDLGYACSHRSHFATKLKVEALGLEHCTHSMCVKT